MSQETFDRALKETAQDLIHDRIELGEFERRCEELYVAKHGPIPEGKRFVVAFDDRSPGLVCGTIDLPDPVDSAWKFKWPKQGRGPDMNLTDDEAKLAAELLGMVDDRFNAEKMTSLDKAVCARVEHRLKQYMAAKVAESKETITVHGTASGRTLCAVAIPDMPEGEYCLPWETWAKPIATWRCLVGSGHLDPLSAVHVRYPGCVEGLDAMVKAKRT